MVLLAYGRMGNRQREAGSGPAMQCNYGTREEWCPRKQITGILSSVPSTIPMQMVGSPSSSHVACAHECAPPSSSKYLFQAYSEPTTQLQSQLSLRYQRRQTWLRSSRAVDTQHARGACSTQAEPAEGLRWSSRESATEAAAGGPREVSRVYGNQEGEAELYSQESG